MKKNIFFIILAFASLVFFYSEEVLEISENHDHHFVESGCGLIPLKTDSSVKPVRSKHHKYVKNDKGQIEVIPFKSCPATSMFSVIYQEPVPANVKTAFEFALGLWEQYIDSDYEIVVYFQYIPLGGALGFAGPQSFYKFPGFTDNLPLDETWYPIPLINHIEQGQPLMQSLPNNIQINAQFNSSRTDWYFGLDANPPSNQFDFVTVALHEIGHGIGFLGSGDANTNDLCDSSNPPVCYPIIYNRNVEDGNGMTITDFVDPSASLTSALASNNLFLTGTNVESANGNLPAKIYAPTTYQPGSSIGHLDETTFAAGGPNSLMTPILTDGEAIHDPGAIVLGLFQDIGYAISTCGQTPSGDCTDSDIVTIAGGTITTDQTVKTSGDSLVTAMATVTINNNADVLWQAKDNIQLNPIFSVETGSTLELRTEDCENSGSPGS